MSGNTTNLIAFNYFGGKFSWLHNLYQYFPNQYDHLVDLFAGSYVVSLNAPGNIIRTANDINDNVTNFFEVLRDYPEVLVSKLKLTPVSVSEYNNSWEDTDCKIENARRFYVRVRQSFFGLGAQRKNKGWHMAVSGVNATGGETVSRWNNSLDKLIEVAYQLRSKFQITNYDAVELIDKTNKPKTFFYVDYPYDCETRNSKNDYKFEFSDEKKIELSEKLHQIDGLAMVSGYPGGITEELYKDWRQIRFPKKANHIKATLRKKDKKVEVQECIWINYDVSITRMSQPELF